jgi:hypothetical protein
VVPLQQDAQDAPDRLALRLIAPSLAPGKSLPYTLLVATQSDLKLDAELHASDLYVGTKLLFSALLTQFGRPLRKDIAVTVELRHPDGDLQHHTLSDSQEPGRFGLRLETLRPGHYEARFIARGRSLFGRRFRREALRTILILPESARLDPELETPPTPASQRDKSRQ